MNIYMQHLIIWFSQCSALSGALRFGCSFSFISLRDLWIGKLHMQNMIKLNRPTLALNKPSSAPLLHISVSSMIISFLSPHPNSSLRSFELFRYQKKISIVWITELHFDRFVWLELVWEKTRIGLNGSEIDWNSN